MSHTVAFRTMVASDLQTGDLLLNDSLDILGYVDVLMSSDRVIIDLLDQHTFASRGHFGTTADNPVRIVAAS